MYFFPIYDPKGSIKFASENPNKRVGNLVSLCVQILIEIKEIIKEFEVCKLPAAAERAILLPSPVWLGSLLSNPVTSLAVLSSIESRQEQAYFKKPACATIVKSWLSFFPLRAFQKTKVFFHGLRKMKWETTALGYKYFVYKNWKWFWEVVFKDSFLIENGFEKTQF